jgi:hypothetical protein
VAEGLSLPDGTAPAAAAVDAENGEADFNRLMATASEGVSGPDSAEPAPLPKREPADPDKPRRGRPTKDVRARTRNSKPGEGKPGKDGKPAELTPKDFKSDLTAIGDGLWISLSMIPVTAPYAALVHMQQDGLVSAINEGAQVNPGVRNAVEKLTSGTGSAWALQLGLIGANICMQGWQLMKDPDLRRQLTEANTAQVQQYMQAMGAVPVADAA